MAPLPPCRLIEFQKNVILSCIHEGIRTDGRGMGDGRQVHFKFSFTDRGHAEVTIGATRVLCVVSGEVVKPSPDRPNEGSIFFNVDFTPMASAEYDIYPSPGSPTYEKAAELALLVESILKKSRSIDTEALHIEGGSKVWSLSVELRVLDDDGNVTDAAALAALAGLLHFRRKKEIECREIQKNADRLPPAPLSIHHMPVLVTLCFLDADGLFVVDATREEEAIATGKISIAVNQFQELCGIHKSGGQPIRSEILKHAIRVAAARASGVISLLLDSLKAHDKQREERRKNIWQVYEPNLVCPEAIVLKNQATPERTEPLSTSAIPVDSLPTRNAEERNSKCFASLSSLKGDVIDDVAQLKVQLKKKRKKLLKDARRVASRLPSNSDLEASEDLQSQAHVSNVSNQEEYTSLASENMRNNKGRMPPRDAPLNNSDSLPLSASDTTQQNVTDEENDDFSAAIVQTAKKPKKGPARTKKKLKLSLE